MEWINIHLRELFFICVGIFIVSSIAMGWYAKRFITMPPEAKKFSIFRLEFPGSDAQLSKLILQMSPVVKSAVTSHVYLDFLFMLGAYPGIAIICYKMSLVVAPTQPEAAYFLIAMAAIQLFAFVCDGIENIMLLRKLNNINSWKEGSHERFSQVVFFKFVTVLISLAAVTCTMIYWWLSNKVPLRYINGVAIITAILIVYVAVKALVKRYYRRKKDRLQLQRAQ